MKTTYRLITVKQNELLTYEICGIEDTVCNQLMEQIADDVCVKDLHHYIGMERENLACMGYETFEGPIQIDGDMVIGDSQ